MNKPKERPILFSGPMVRAILEGRKTETRRIVKPQPPELDKHFSWAIDADGVLYAKGGPGAGCADTATDHRSPYGKPGDRLWVRETWGLRAYGDITDWNRDSIRGADADTIETAGEMVDYQADWDANQEPCFWRPSIHMPRWASRITLEVTSVRVERLNDISEKAALAEGVQGHPFFPDDGFPLSTGYMVGPDDKKTPLHPTPQGAFRELWESINGASSWDANPWVWVLQFKRVE